MVMSGEKAEAAKAGVAGAAPAPSPAGSGAGRLRALIAGMSRDNPFFRTRRWRPQAELLLPALVHVRGWEKLLHRCHALRELARRLLFADRCPYFDERRRLCAASGEEERWWCGAELTERERAAECAVFRETRFGGGFAYLLELAEWRERLAEAAAELAAGRAEVAERLAQEAARWAAERAERTPWAREEAEALLAEAGELLARARRVRELIRETAKRVWGGARAR